MIPLLVHPPYGADDEPSTGAISLQGVKPLSEYSDTAGVLARDPEKFRAFIKAW